MNTHTCPHGGVHPDYPPPEVEKVSGRWLCGEFGWLCDMCKRDADCENTDRLVEGLALAGVLADNWMAPDAVFKDGGDAINKWLAQAARKLAAALRGREGGEEQ